MKFEIKCPKCKHKIILESEVGQPDTITMGSTIWCNKCRVHFAPEKAMDKKERQ